MYPLYPAPRFLHRPETLVRDVLPLIPHPRRAVENAVQRSLCQPYDIHAVVDLPVKRIALKAKPAHLTAFVRRHIIHTLIDADGRVDVSQRLLELAAHHSRAALFQTDGKHVKSEIDCGIQACDDEVRMSSFK